MEGQHSGNRWEPTGTTYTPETAPTPPVPADRAPAPAAPAPSRRSRVGALAVAGALALTTAGGFVVTRAFIAPEDTPAYVSPTGVTHVPDAATFSGERQDRGDRGEGLDTEGDG